MVDSTNSAVFRLADLPAELIVEIAIWAQILWREAEFVVQAPYERVKRYIPTLGPLRHTRSIAPCCHGVDDNRSRPRCLSVSVPASLRSPAHCLSQTGSWLRNLLITENSALWRLDNVLFREIADRSGVQVALVAGRPFRQYGARTLVATHVCACLIRGLPSFYRTLENVKIALPSRNLGAMSNVQEFFIRNAGGGGGPLRRFALEIYSDEPAEPPYGQHTQIRGINSDGLLSGSFKNTTFYFYSSCLTSLHIYQDVLRLPRFDSRFSVALQQCATCLEYLTLDTGDASFRGLEVVNLPQLQYLRLVVPDEEAWRILASLELPADIDVHLELVVNWASRSRLKPWSEVQFMVFEWEDENTGGALWQYASTLAAPEQTAGIFRSPAAFNVSDDSLWPTLNTVGVDIKLDHASMPSERACSRFPEYVSLSFAGSVPEMKALLANVGQASARGQPRDGSRRVKRSLAVRNVDFVRPHRNQSLHPTLLKPLYDSVQYVARTSVMERTGSPFTGHRGVYNLVFQEETWLPEFSLGWRHILGAFAGLIAIVIPCRIHLLAGDEDGFLAPVYLRALALYLNEPGEGHVYPCAGLSRVELPNYFDAGGLRRSQEAQAQIQSIFNGPERVHAGCALVEVIIGGEVSPMGKRRAGASRMQSCGVR